MFARALLVLAVLLAPAARAADITLLCTTALRTVVEELAPAFERATGDRLVITFDTSNRLRDQIVAGTAFDVAILTPALIEGLGPRIASGSQVNVARAGLGVAVRAGASRPDISSEAALRAALLAAPSVAFSTTGQSGAAFGALIERMGIATEIRGRALLVPTGPTAEPVAQGRAALAVQLIPELLPVAGVDIVGPFPPGAQSWVVLAAGLGGGERGQGFLRFLGTAEAVAVIRAKGLEPG